MSDSRVVILVELFSTTCLYGMNLGGTKVLSVDFNEIFLLLFVVTFGNFPHHHSLYP